MRFDDVVLGHIGWIARVAFRFCHRKADADDLAQETLCRIYANRDKFDLSRDFKPWALTVMGNIARGWYARSKRIGFSAPYEDAEGMESHFSADGPLLCRDVCDAVRRSSHECVGVRCVVLYAEGYSYDEIADIVGVRPGTVKSRISSGRAAIRKALGESPP